MPRMMTFGAESDRPAHYYLVLSDRASVAALAFTWILLLIAYVRSARRNRRLQRRLAGMAGA
ncbi:MAG: hypothetical protein IT325_05715 [Anaerolineae bacterium]|nr:hypothetical protein [Anaerolineae bacterium]